MPLLRACTRRGIWRVAAAAVGVLSAAGSRAFAKDDDNHGSHRNLHLGRDEGGPQSLSCFLRGTRIATASGARPVDELQIGEHVSTIAGPKPIKWIGYRRFRRDPGKRWVAGVLPVCIARDAVARDTPQRDVYLSPAHRLFLDNVLIAAEYLVNDASIRRALPQETDVIEYYHIELATHEVIFAEGLPVESYIGSDRENFSNFTQFERLYGSESHSQKTPCAPTVGYYGGRDELKGLLKSAVSPLIDIRDPVQIAWDRIALRARELL